VSSDALSGRLAADSVALAGTNVSVPSNVDRSMNFTVPLGTPPSPGLAETVAVRVVVRPGGSVYVPEVKVTVNELVFPADS
jgi:hypothetical protein